VKVNRCFRGTHHLYLYGQGISQARKQHKEGSIGLPFNTEDGDGLFLQNVNWL
jgi:hypothetical protein